MYTDQDSVDLPLLSNELQDQKEHLTNAGWNFNVPKRRTQRRDILLASLATCSLTILIMLGLSFMVYRHIQSQPLQWESFVGEDRPGTASCGAAIDEALARGCVFDELSMMWMPQKCTRVYNDEYLSSNNGEAFQYWTDRHAVQRIDDPSLHIENESIFWTSRRNHIVHCQYNLYRLAHALKSGDYIGHDYGSALSDHMHHCVMIMAEFALKAPAHEIEVTDIIAEASFGYC